MAAAVVERHQGEVPATMDALVKLPGVGRKTANVVLGHALGVPGLPVDRHVLRVANRIGIAKGDDPEVVEQQLCAAMPPAKWTVTSDTLILHGRRICKPRPLCDRCAVREDCAYYRAAMGAVVASRGPAVRKESSHRSERNRVRKGSLPGTSARAAKHEAVGRRTQYKHGASPANISPVSSKRRCATSRDVSAPR